MKLADIRRGFGAVFDGNLTFFNGPVVPVEVAPRLRAEQVDAVSRYTLTLMSGNIVAALTIVLGLWPEGSGQAAFIWSFALITFALFIYLRRRSAAGRVLRSRSTRSIRRVTFNAFLLGLLWSIPPAFFFVEAGHDLQLLMACLVIGMLCAGAFALAAVPLAAFAFILPVFAGAASGFLRADDRVYLGVAALLALYTLMLLRAIVAHAMAITTRFLTQIAGEEATNADGLTHLPNRFAFRTTIEGALMRAHRYGETFSLLLFNIDDFGAINKDFGRAAGDDLLIQAAARLKSCTRDNDVLARLGEDTFALLANQIETPEQAVILVERASRSFGSPFAVGGRQARVSMSTGIVMVPQDGQYVDTLMKKANEALGAAKAARRGGFMFHDEQHEVFAREQRTLASDLRKALVRGEFKLVYQPLFNLQQRRITGCEALLRWNHPVRGEVSPTQFIPLAESMGIIQDIGEWVINEALRTATKWPDHVRIAMNMSALQFRTIDVVNALSRAIRETSIEPHRIEIEITESSLISDTLAALDVLNSIRAMGAQVALDDFGTGYSSLTYLATLPLDRLKIDRSFVQQAPTNAASTILLRTVCTLAHELGIKVTGEGVETNAHLASLIANRVDEVQGYLLGRPMSAEKIAIELLRDNEDAVPAILSATAA
jgi:diguanylate cyclase (GGDEF)-like protein